MLRQRRQTKERVGKLENRSTGNVQRSKGRVPSSKRALSTSEILELWAGLEVRVVGLVRVSGERSAVAAITTILGFVILVLNHFPLEVCLFEGVLGTGLVWMLIRKTNGKNKDSS